MLVTILSTRPTNAMTPPRRRCASVIFSRRASAAALWLIWPILIAGCTRNTPPEPPEPQQTAVESPPPPRSEAPSAEAPAETPRRATAAERLAAEALADEEPTEGQPTEEERQPTSELAADPGENPTGDGGDGAAALDGRPLQAPPRTDEADATVEPAEMPADPLAAYDGKSEAEIAAEKAFAAPEGMRQLTPDARMWIDRQRGRVVVDGYVTLREGPLEMFACPVGTKEHESVVSVLSRARYVHAALLAIGAMPGTPVSFAPEYRPATGQRIAIWVMWRDADGKIQKVPAQQWVEKTGTGQPLETDWVFAGSSFWRDPETGQEHYQADAGDLVCVSNFTTATLDLPVESSQSNAALQYSAFTENIPPRGTPVRLVFVPIPLPADDPNPEAESRADPQTPPEDELLKPQPEGEN